MSELFKEIGKALFAMANLLAIVVFFKAFQESGNINDFISAIISFIMIYGFGVSFFILGILIDEEKDKK